MNNEIEQSRQVFIAKLNGMGFTENSDMNNCNFNIGPNASDVVETMNFINGNFKECFLEELNRVVDNEDWNNGVEFKLNVAPYETSTKATSNDLMLWSIQLHIPCHTAAWGD